MLNGASYERPVTEVDSVKVSDANRRTLYGRIITSEPVYKHHTPFRIAEHRFVQSEATPPPSREANARGLEVPRSVENARISKVGANGLWSPSAQPSSREDRGGYPAKISNGASLLEPLVSSD